MRHSTESVENLHNGDDRHGPSHELDHTGVICESQGYLVPEDAHDKQVEDSDQQSTHNSLLSVSRYSSRAVKTVTVRQTDHFGAKSCSLRKSGAN